MTKLRKILVPLDGSKNSFRGLDKAISIAKQSESIITGMFVIPSLNMVIAARGDWGTWGPGTDSNVNKTLKMLVEAVGDPDTILRTVGN